MKGLYTRERVGIDPLIERDPRGSVWVKGRVCAVLIYLGWTLLMLALFTHTNPKNFSGGCAIAGLWLCGIGLTSGLVWLIRKGP